MKSTASTPSKPDSIIGSLKRLLIWALILACWETAFRTLQWKAWQFPAPSTLWPALVGLLKFMPAYGGRPLIGAIGVSLSRLAVGFALSVLLGGLLGMLMWRLRSVDQFFGPLFLGLQTLPSVCWVPLAVLVIGLNEFGVLFVVVMGSFFAIAIAQRDGMRTIPPIYQRAGAMLGTRGWRMYRYVLLPASLPALSSSLRQGFSFAWRSLMGAELIFAVTRHGLGFLLEMGRNFSDVAQVVVVMAVMVTIGILADRLVFARVERTIHQRFGLAGVG